MNDTTNPPSGDTDQSMAHGPSVSDVVGSRVTALRKNRGWNRERLAAECAKVGMPELTHAAITNIESGRRNPDGVRRRTVTVDELVALADAFVVPSLSMLTGYPEEQWRERALAAEEKLRAIAALAEGPGRDE